MVGDLPSPTSKPTLFKSSLIGSSVLLTGNSVFHMCRFKVQLLWSAFAFNCWQFIGIEWDHSLSFFDTVIKAKQQFDNNFFMDVMGIAAWEIWKLRNGKIFRNEDVSLDLWKVNFEGSLLLNLSRMTVIRRAGLEAWWSVFS